MATLFDDFWRHPIGRAAEALRWVILIRLNNLLRTAKVRQLAPSIVPDQDVRGLDVSMNDVVLVKVFKAKQDLLRVGSDHIFVEIVALVVLLKATRRHVLEEDIEMLTVLVRAQILHNILVVQAVQELYFLLEGAYFALLCALTCSNFVDWHLLNGNLPPVRLINTLIYMSERAVADHFAELPLSYRKRFLLLLNERQRILMQIVLNLRRIEVAIFVVVALEVILVLLIICVGHLGLAERTRSPFLNVYLSLH